MRQVVVDVGARSLERWLRVCGSSHLKQAHVPHGLVRSLQLSGRSFVIKQRQPTSVAHEVPTYRLQTWVQPDSRRQEADEQWVVRSVLACVCVCVCVSALSHSA
jgi:hypothetical protein